MKRTFFALTIGLLLSSYARADVPLHMTLTCHQHDSAEGMVTFKATFQPTDEKSDDVMSIINMTGTADLSLKGLGFDVTSTVPLAGALLPQEGPDSEFIEFHPTVAAGNQSLRSLVFHIDFNSGAPAQAWVFSMDNWNKEIALDCARGD